MTVTYDPIKEVTELRRVRLAAPIRPPAMGTALVIEPLLGEPFVVSAGERVPDARFGNYRRCFLVDLAQYGLRLQLDLPSRDPSFAFKTTVDFSCRVLDPVLVVKNGVRDMTRALRASIVKVTRGIAQRYDVLDVTAAELALNDALERFRGDSVVSLGRFLVTLDSGETSEIHNLRRETRLGGMRRDDMRTVVKGGQDELFAQLLAKSDSNPAALIEHIAAEKGMEQERLLEALKIVSGSAEKTEAFDTRRERDRIFDQLIGGSDGRAADGGAEPGRRLRRSRVVGSLTSGTSDKGPSDKGPSDAAPADPPATEQPSTSDEKPAARPSRVRGLRPKDEKGTL
jgi:hypothetical protein